MADFFTLFVPRLEILGDYEYDLKIFAAWLVIGTLALVVPLRRRLEFYLALSLGAQIALRGQGFLAFLVPDLIIYAFTVWLARGDEKRPPGFRWGCCCAAMVVIAVTALAGRHWAWDEWRLVLGDTEWPVFSLGMIHMTLLVTFLWEFGSRRIELPRLGHYALWRNLPLHFVFLRYSDFHGQLPRIAQRPRLGEFLTRPRVVLAVLAAVQLYLALICVQTPQLLFGEEGHTPLWGKIAIALIYFPWGWYLWYAGASNILRVAGASWNLAVPVNFNKPFFRTNLSEFWMNWNITLTTIWRDYFFFNRWGFARVNLYVNALILFLAMGVWHALNAYWVLFGLLHGLGFCAYIWFAQLKRRHPGKFQLKGWPGKLLSGAVTYLFVCSSWTLPSLVLRVVRV
jgi:hypothetical protein